MGKLEKRVFGLEEKIGYLEQLAIVRHKILLGHRDRIMAAEAEMEPMRGLRAKVAYLFDSNRDTRRRLSLLEEKVTYSHCEGCRGILPPTPTTVVYREAQIGEQVKASFCNLNCVHQWLNEC